MDAPSDSQLLDAFDDIKGPGNRHRAYADFKGFCAAIEKFKPDCMREVLHTAQLEEVAELHFRNVCEAGMQNVEEERKLTKVCDVDDDDVEFDESMDVPDEDDENWDKGMKTIQAKPQSSLDFDDDPDRGSRSMQPVKKEPPKLRESKDLPKFGMSSGRQSRADLLIAGELPVEELKLFFNHFKA